MADRETIEPDELKNLSPKEKIQKLKELEEQRKKELEETRKQVETEIAAAEDLIKRTEQEVAVEKLREQQREEKAQEKKRWSEEEEQEEAEDLEERLVGVRAAQTQERQYQTGAEYRPGGERPEIYRTLDTAASALEQLYGKREWSDRDQQLYVNTKEKIERISTYKLATDRLEEELGLATNVLKRLQYRR